MRPEIRAFLLKWREVIAAGEVEASTLFTAWAQLSGQGGYDEAAGVTGSDT